MSAKSAPHPSCAVCLQRDGVRQWRSRTCLPACFSTARVKGEVSAAGGASVRYPVEANCVSDRLRLTRPRMKRGRRSRRARLGGKTDRKIQHGLCQRLIRMLSIVAGGASLTVSWSCASSVCLFVRQKRTEVESSLVRRLSRARGPLAWFFENRGLSPSPKPQKKTDSPFP
jgi:hypothetical protein